MKIKYSKKFVKRYKKCSPKIQKIFIKRLNILIKNKQDSLLNYHKLHGKFKNVSSINLSGDWRVLFIEYNKDTLYFVAIGTHSKLYL